MRKADQVALKRCGRTIARIHKEIENLERARDKFSFESPEYHLIGQSMYQLNEARKDLEIVINRIRQSIQNT